MTCEKQFFIRENYLSRLRRFYHDISIVKAVTGIRRCGKSVLMQEVINELKGSGIAEERIIYINLDRHGFKRIRTVKALQQKIDSMVQTDQIKYLFIDEIQYIMHYEEVIKGYLETGEYSIFLTGSRNSMVSDTLVSLMNDQVLHVRMFPLTLEEYLDWKAFKGLEIDSDLTKELDVYLKQGGFPETLEYKTNEARYDYARDVIEEAVRKDITFGRQWKEDKFRQLMNYLIEHSGEIESLTALQEAFADKGIQMHRVRIKSCIDALCDANILYRSRLINLRKKKQVRGLNRYYPADVSIRLGVSPALSTADDVPVKNIVCLYGASKGYEACTGRIDDETCDFVMIDGKGGVSFVQITKTILGEVKKGYRPLRLLKHIKENLPKYVITRNDEILLLGDIDHVNIVPFMKSGRLFSI